MDPRLPIVFSTRTAHELGYSTNQIQHRVRSGRWTGLRRGCYCHTAHFKHLATTAEGRRLLDIAAGLVAAGPDAVASLWSAALLQDLPLASGQPRIVTLVRTSGEARKLPGLHIDVARLPEDHRDTRKNALRSTTPARTAVDIARRSPFIDAVMVADAALHRRLVTKADLVAVLRTQAGWPGVARAHDVIEFADARSESPLESRSRVRMFEAALPMPEPQVDVRTDDGKVIARVDFLWADRRTVGEADGKVKYAGEDGETLFAEKKREDAIRRLRWEVVRWTSEEVERRFRVVERRIQAAFASAEERGWTR